MNQLVLQGLASVLRSIGAPPTLARGWVTIARPIDERKRDTRIILLDATIQFCNNPDRGITFVAVSLLLLCSVRDSTLLTDEQFDFSPFLLCCFSSFARSERTTTPIKQAQINK